MQQTFQHWQTRSKGDPFLLKGIGTVGRNEQAQSRRKLMQFQEQPAVHRIAEPWRYQRHNELNVLELPL